MHAVHPTSCQGSGGFTSCFRRASATGSDVVVSSRFAMGAAIGCVWTSSTGSHTFNDVPLLEMLLWSQRSYQLWPFLELRLMFLFFALLILPRLLSVLASHAFVLRQIVLFPIDVVSWLGAAAAVLVVVVS